MQYIAGLFLFVVGAFIGLKLPDFDLVFRWWPLIEHRSLLTHGLLIPLLLFATLKTHVIGKQADPRLRLALLGFYLATAVHLCFDLFPSRWYGMAHIHIPLLGWVGEAPSVLWMGVGAFVSLYLACRLLRHVTDVGLGLLGLATSYGVSAAHEPRPSFFALMVLVPLALGAFLLPRRLHDPESPADEISRWMRS